MAATKRKRRGGLEVQAKKPKRSQKVAEQPDKRAAAAKEVEEEDRDCIPGPVCKVKSSDPGVRIGFVTRLWATEVITAKVLLDHEFRGPLDWTGQYVCLIFV